MSGIVAACLILMQLTGQTKNFDKSPFQLIIQLIGPLLVWYWGIKAKKKLLNNKLTFKQGFLEGIKISLVFAITSPFVFLIYYTLINPSMLNYVRTVYHLANVNNQTVIAFDMITQFIVAMIFGTILSAMVALFLKSRNKSKS